MERARRQLEGGEAEDALATLEEHRRRFAEGLLTQERQALVVRALATAGYHQRAKRAASAFEREFPSSVYRTIVRESVSDPVDLVINQRGRAQ